MKMLYIQTEWGVKSDTIKVHHMQPKGLLDLNTPFSLCSILKNTHFMSTSKDLKLSHLRSNTSTLYQFFLLEHVSMGNWMNSKKHIFNEVFGIQHILEDIAYLFPPEIWQMLVLEMLLNLSISQMSNEEG